MKYTITIDRTKKTTYTVEAYSMTEAEEKAEYIRRRLQRNDYAVFDIAETFDSETPQEAFVSLIKSNS